MKRRVGILFQPMSRAAEDLAGRLEKVVSSMGVEACVCSSWEEDKARTLTSDSELIVCLGGDGTILRAARIVDGKPIPILGVNLGRLGFMTELCADEALSRVPDFIKGDGWIEERSMLQAEITSSGGKVYHALNDMIVGRSARARLVRILAHIDGEQLTTYKCDGVIVSTATGSTGYSLAAGGPVLHPCSAEMILQPVAAHLSLNRALVLPSDCTLDLKVSTTHGASLTIDGQIEVPVNDGDTVRVKRSPRTTRMVRSQRPRFYETLVEKLAWRE